MSDDVGLPEPQLVMSTHLKLVGPVRQVAFLFFQGSSVSVDDAIPATSVVWCTTPDPEFLQRLESVAKVTRLLLSKVHQQQSASCSKSNLS